MAGPQITNVSKWQNMYITGISRHIERIYTFFFISLERGPRSHDDIKKIIKFDTKFPGNMYDNWWLFTVTRKGRFKSSMFISIYLKCGVVNTEVIFHYWWPEVFVSGGSIGWHGVGFVVTAALIARSMVNGPPCRPHWAACSRHRGNVKQFHIYITVCRNVKIQGAFWLLTLRLHACRQPV